MMDHCQARKKGEYPTRRSALGGVLVGYTLASGKGRTDVGYRLIS
jgi:hypothetical protein